MINVVFCDDNSEFMNMLAMEVKRNLEQSTIRKFESFSYRCYDSGLALLDDLSDKSVDIAFLDIDMKQLNGFDLAKKLLQLNENVLIVFVSGYDQFVYDVFEFSPVAFIRKMHVSKELPRVLKRIVDIIDEANSKFEINTVDGRVNIKAKDIVYINSIGNYCYIRMVANQQHVCRETLANMEAMLQTKGFYRVHSAYLINMHHIHRIERNNSVLMGNEKIAVPIAQRRFAGFKKAYSDIVVGRML